MLDYVFLTKVWNYYNSINIVIKLYSPKPFLINTQNLLQIK